MPRIQLPRGGRAVGLVLGVVAYLAILLFAAPLRADPAWGARPAFAAAAAALMAIWWLSEAIPIYWTAALPLLLFPLTGVFGRGLLGDLGRTVDAYVDPYLFLFAGGMAIAGAMQQWNLHRRIALSVMKAIGTEPARLLAGLLAATAFISLWISNTATAAMTLPIGLALIAQIERSTGGRRLQHFGAALMLAIAYGANVGGIGTKIGTVPNAQFAGFLERRGTPISFLEFTAVGLPFVLMFLPVVWLALWRIGRKEDFGAAVGAAVIADELARLGPVRRAEKIILAVFAVTAMVWIFGKGLGATLARVWPGAGITSAHVEGGVAVLAALVLLLLRSERQPVLALASLKAVPWETLLLLGGGFALAAGVQDSGLSVFLSRELAGIRDLPPGLQVVIAALAAVGISAVASNTSTIAVLLVVLAEAAAPEILPTVLFTATVGASCDFALPAGTPPNAIVFGSGYVTIPRMARTGVVLDLAAALLAAAWCWLVVDLVL